MTTSPFSLHTRVTESHPGCLRQSCRLPTEPHQSHIRIKASKQSTLHRYSKIKRVVVPARGDANEDRSMLFGAEIKSVA